MKKESIITEEELQLRSLLILKKCIKNKQTVAIAESCTGGKIASLLSCHPSSSEYFLGGVVCYSNQLKVDLLGVNQLTLEKKGAVSKETVIEMVQGLKKITGADINISVSGVAGPSGGTEEKPVGRIFIGRESKGRVIYMEKTFLGSRKQIVNKIIEYIFKKMFLI